MPKYLFQGSYRPEGHEGSDEGGRQPAPRNLETLVKQQGGRLEAFYFTFGDADAIASPSCPTTSRRRPLSLAINASGLVGVRTTVLLTTDEMDQATKKHRYRPPATEESTS